MISGEYSHTLDAKGRVILPAKLREDLGDELMLVKGVDKCVSVYPMETWQRFEQKLDALPEISGIGIKRYFYASAFKTFLDSQGRLLVTPKLREHAALSREITVIGVGDHAEIWDAEIWESKCAETSPEEIAAALAAVGL